MTEYVHLIGAEKVETAGYRIAHAAEEMVRAAAILDEVLRQQQRFMDDWLNRFEAIMQQGKNHGAT